MQIRKAGKISADLSTNMPTFRTTYVTCFLTIPTKKTKTKDDRPTKHGHVGTQINRNLT